MNAILEKKAALAEDTILRAIAPAMKKRQPGREFPCESSDPVSGHEDKRQALCA